MISKIFKIFFIFFAIFLFGACNSASNSGDEFSNSSNGNDSFSRVRMDTLTGCLSHDSRRQDFRTSCNELTTEGVRIENAGIVLANNYIPMLFQRLGLLGNNQLLEYESKKQAVRVLNFLGAGVTNLDQNYLMLNKILSGLDVNEDIDTSIEPSEDEKNQITALIRAMVNHWPAIGHSSVYEFRTNWFIRSGILSETNETWELVVERRPYDVLLSKSPFSFSIVNYPWMKKPLFIRWSY